ncbi:CRISPR-associated protein Cas4 [Thiocapsa roseopersicina]|uniref:CRISPR-associated exonuclease Cas4 n=1 Tax=Thiocapsa roseopersicina TaxID=1058 RepID=A0A1H2XQK9_THIRO|nr:CRISPR-associated protein Cas4 [Thiocapsa roseopersicina]SDW94804.1 CRISPR-associated exonuclease, Cas4 family [Thiocapsa roseopersicina]
MNDDTGLVPAAMAVDPVNLSALNQYSYCPRRCGLIYLDGEFEQNVHTARGNAEHEKVDRASHVAGHEGARLEYALPVWSDRYGLIGKCDVVELWPDGTIYPVEYKHGPRKKHINDDLQLVAQALCLEEIFGRAVLKGAIYHAASRRRREVLMTPELRRLVVESAEAIRAMLASGRLPPPVNDRRCDQCSLNAICDPAGTAAVDRHVAALHSLFQPDDSEGSARTSKRIKP